MYLIFKPWNLLSSKAFGTTKGCNNIELTLLFMLRQDSFMQHEMSKWNLTYYQKLFSLEHFSKNVIALTW